MQRVSIETAASLLGISPRLLRRRIEKKIAPIRLLGGPGPQKVDLNAVLQYLDEMPPTKATKPTASAALLSVLTSKLVRASTRATTGAAKARAIPSPRRSGSSLKKRKATPCH